MASPADAENRSLHSQLDSLKEYTHGGSNAGSSPEGRTPSTTSETEKGQTEKAPAPPAGPNPDDFPDGGLQAWLCVLGGFNSLFVSFGWINCVGVFQNFWETNYLKEYNPSTVAWISSLMVCLMFLGGSWVGRIYDKYGPRWLLLIGSFLHVFGLMMASLSTEYYQIMLSQALVSPIGASMVFYPSLSTVMTWFFKRRALAAGLVSTGGSLGGVIFPIMVQRLIPLVGYPWTLRICAFMILGMLVFTNLFVKSRIQPTPSKVRLMDFVTPLKEPAFALFTAGMFLFFFGQFVPFTYIILAARKEGMSAELAGYLVPILNGASVFGRVVPAPFADKYGRFNVMIVMAIVTLITVLAIWIPATNNAVTFVFAGVFGFSSGVIVSLAPPMIAQISEIRQVGVRTGTVFTFVSVAILVSNPIAGALVQAEHGEYTYAKIFAGCMMVGGTFFYIASRVALAGPALLRKV